MQDQVVLISVEYVTVGQSTCLQVELVFGNNRGPLTRMWALKRGALVAAQLEDVAAYVKSATYQACLHLVGVEQELPLA